MKFALWDQVMKHYYSAWAQGWRRHWARWQTPNTQRPCTQTMWNEQAPSNSFLLTCHAVHSNFVRSILAKVTMLQGFRYKREKLGGFVLISMGLSLMNDCNACMHVSLRRSLIDGGSGELLMCGPLMLCFLSLVKKHHFVSWHNQMHYYLFIIQCQGSSVLENKQFIFDLQAESIFFAYNTKGTFWAWDPDYEGGLVWSIFWIQTDPDMPSGITSDEPGN